jgi:hypothetical protein
MIYLPIGLRRLLLTAPHWSGQAVQADQADRTQPPCGSVQATWQGSAWAGGMDPPASSRQSSSAGRPAAPALVQDRPRLRRPSPQVRPWGRWQADQSPGSQRACLQLAASSGHGRTCTSAGQRSPPCRAASSTLRSRRWVSMRSITPPSLPAASSEVVVPPFAVDVFLQVSGQRDHSAHSDTRQARGQGTAQWRRFSRVRRRLHRQAGRRLPALSTQFTFLVWRPWPQV